MITTLITTRHSLIRQVVSSSQKYVRYKRAKIVKIKIFRDNQRRLRESWHTVTHRRAAGHASVIFLRSTREQFRLSKPRKPNSAWYFLLPWFFPTVCLHQRCHGARHVPCYDVTRAHVWDNAGTRLGDKAVTGNGGGLRRVRGDSEPRVRCLLLSRLRKLKVS